MDNITYVLKNPIPPADFIKKYPEVKKVEFNYLIYISNEHPKIFENDNVCDVGMYAGKESYFWVRTATVFYNQGDKFDWNNVPMTTGTGYPKTKLPYYGVLQVQVKLFQMDYNEVSNDAIIMYKIPFMITSRPKRPIFYIICVAIVFIILAIGVFIVLRFTTRAVEQKIRNSREDIRYQSASANDNSASTGLELN